MARVYEIVDYDGRYRPKNTRGEDLKRPDYVKLPVKPRGRGVRTLLQKPNGIQVFGVWALLLEAATEYENSQFRGQLLNHRDEPATIAEIAQAISLDSQEQLVEDALSALVEMGWISIAAEVRSAYVGPTYPLRTHDADLQHKSKSKSKTKNKLKLKSKSKIKPNDNSNGSADLDDCSPDSDSTSTRPVSTRPSAADRLGFAAELRRTLGAVSKADTTALWNLQAWADNTEDPAGLYRQILQLAGDSKNGKKPIAVFFSRLEKELGYRANTEQQKRGVK